MSIYIKLVQFQKPSGRKGNGFVPTKSRDIQCPMPHCGPRPLHRTRTALYLLAGDFVTSDLAWWNFLNRQVYIRFHSHVIRFVVAPRLHQVRSINFGHFSWLDIGGVVSGFLFILRKFDNDNFIPFRLPSPNICLKFIFTRLSSRGAVRLTFMGWDSTLTRSMIHARTCGFITILALRVLNISWKGKGYPQAQPIGQQRKVRFY